jgi:hypothetical protein
MESLKFDNRLHALFLTAIVLLGLCVGRAAHAEALPNAAPAMEEIVVVADAAAAAGKVIALDDNTILLAQAEAPRAERTIRPLPSAPAVWMQGGPAGPAPDFLIRAAALEVSPLTDDSARRIVDGFLALQGLDRLKAGRVAPLGEDRLAVAVVTRSGDDIGRMVLDKRTRRPVSGLID